MSVQGFSERWKQTAGGGRWTGTEKAGWIRAAVHARGRHRHHRGRRWIVAGRNPISPSNLSEDTREQDLQELFRPFGPVTRIYVAINRETGEGRGFAFVNMVSREDGQRAIDKLDGYGYDSLILRVEWPRRARNAAINP